jgi:ribosomal-protein-alanine N-acetyltransferase
LVTARLRLRPPRPEDAAGLLALAADPEVVRFTPLPRLGALAAAEAQLARWLAARARGEVAPWALEHTADGRFVGRCGYVARAWAPAHGRAEVAYVLARPYWGQGLMPEALRAVLAFGFERVGLNRIEATCEPANRRSARVLEKAGLRCEGLLRDYLFDTGAFLDLQLWAVLRREWQSRQRE